MHHAIERDPTEALFRWFDDMLAGQICHDAQHGWQVFSHADVVEVLTDARRFSSDVTRTFNPPQPDYDFFDTGNPVTMDPPRHRELRGLISRLFTTRSVHRLTPRIEQITESLLDAVGRADSFDVVGALAYPLPITVIAEVLGLPIEDEPLFRRWGEALGAVASAGVSPETMSKHVAPAVREMNEYLLEQLRRRRRRPADDVLTGLATARIDGTPPADGELVGLVGLTLLAGHATTLALIANTALCFARDPEAQNAVRVNRALLPAALEETLRIRPPFPRLTRVTAVDTHLGGHEVPAGELVTVWVGAANRDPARFPDPGRFDIHRNTAGHVVFGHGIHFCIGAPLARLEARVALNALLDRLPCLEVDAGGVAEFENPVQILSPRRLPLKGPA